MLLSFVLTYFILISLDFTSVCIIILTFYFLHYVDFTLDSILVYYYLSVLFIYFLQFPLSHHKKDFSALSLLFPSLISDHDFLNEHEGSSPPVIASME